MLIGLGCKDYCRFNIGYVVFFGPNLIAWHSKKQLAISMSSTEAEYCVVTYAVDEKTWMHKMLYDLGFALSTPTKVLCDNISVRYPPKKSYSS